MRLKAVKSPREVCDPVAEPMTPYEFWNTSESDRRSCSFRSIMLSNVTTISRESLKEGNMIYL